MDLEPLGRHDVGETLPCSGCGTVNRASGAVQGVETARCQKCGKLLRYRPALTAEQRAQAQILRVAARALEDEWVGRPGSRARVRRERRETFDGGVLQAAESLRQWARMIHKRPGR